MDGRPDGCSYFTRFWFRSTLSDVSGASFWTSFARLHYRNGKRITCICVFLDNIMCIMCEMRRRRRLEGWLGHHARRHISRCWKGIFLRNVRTACTTNMKTHWQHHEQQRTNERKKNKIDFRPNIRCRCCCERSTFFFLFFSCLDLFAAGVFIRWHYSAVAKIVPVNRHRMASHLVFRILSDALWMESHRKIRNAWCDANTDDDDDDSHKLSGKDTPLFELKQSKAFIRWLWNAVQLDQLRSVHLLRFQISIWQKS